jgi:hypothetical protein
MKMRRNYYTAGIMTLSAMGLYVLWRNRFQVQRFLEARGIRTPMLKGGDMVDTVHSGMAKLAGKAENLSRNASNTLGNAERRAI